MRWLSSLPVIDPHSDTSAIVRVLLAVTLVTMAITFTIVSMAISFLVLPQWLKVQFGIDWGVLPSLTLQAVCLGAVWGMIRLSSLVLAPYAGDIDAPEPEPLDNRERYFNDWVLFNERLIRLRREAYYLKTRQFDRLRQLEQEAIAQGDGFALSAPPEAPAEQPMAADQHGHGV